MADTFSGIPVEKLGFKPPQITAKVVVMSEEAKEKEKKEREETDKTVYEKAFSLAKALLTGTDVSPERLKRRLEICKECPNVRIDSNENMTCGICGCQLRGDKALINLARYEENWSYGCRSQGGSRWQKEGV